MPMMVCLHTNIFDENGEQRLRGDAWEGSQEFADMVLSGDAAAGRPPRIATVEPAKRKPGRPRKDEAHED